jgi:hypothetical protein
VVTFSELAERGLARATESEEQRLGLRHSITLHLAHPDAWEKSVQLPILGGQLYVYSLWKVRVTWELEHDGNVAVWSVTLLRAHRP